MNPSLKLEQRTVRGIAWAFLATAGSRLVWLAGLAVLARVLVPQDFGVFAFALIFIAYAETIGDLGMRAALIYWPARTAEVARITFFANLLMGVAWFSLTQLAAPMVAAFFDQPSAEAVLRVCAASFLIKGLGSTHDALCQKQLRFKARLIPELALVLGKTVPSVLLALAGFGIWGLVIGQLLGLVLWCIALWVIVPWRPGWSISPDLLAPMWRYGRAIVGVNVLAAVVHHVDLLIVGRVFGAEVLGFYHIAAKVPEASLAVVIWVAGMVLFPAFARFRAEGRDLRRPYLAALRYLSLLTLPVAAGLFMLAEPLMLTLFGEAWRSSIPILQAIAVYLGLRSLGTHAGDLLKATGQSGLLVRLTLLRAVALIPALLVAGRYSPVAVAWTLAAVTGATVLVNIAVVSRGLQIRAAKVVRAVRVSLLATTILVSAVAAWRILLPAVDPVLDLLGSLTVGVAVYSVAVRWLDPAVFRTVLRLTGITAGRRSTEHPFEAVGR